jgi:hypothetical protein
MNRVVFLLVMGQGRDIRNYEAVHRNTPDSTWRTGECRCRPRTTSVPYIIREMTSY